MKKMSYDLLLARDYFRFSSAHLVIGKNFFEHLHGHNYEVEVNVFGTQGEGNMIINFYDLKKIVTPLVDKLDHRLLLPGRSKYIIINEINDQVIIKIPRLNKEYEIPKEDVIVLPVENTTVEELSRYFYEELKNEEAFHRENIKGFKITVNEFRKQGVTFEKFL